LSISVTYYVLKKGSAAWNYLVLCNVASHKILMLISRRHTFVVESTDIAL